MSRYLDKLLGLLAALAFLTGLLAGCASYEAKPLPFKDPSAMPNRVETAGATIAAQAFADDSEAKEAFGFDVRGAGLLPIQVVIDNHGQHPLEIIGDQAFLADKEGKLWPVLSGQIAYERVTKYAQTKNIVKEGAYGGLLGAAGGAIIGAAIGIVSGQGVGEAIGKGAAVGAAAGATVGGAKGYVQADEARKRVMDDFQAKQMQNKSIPSGGLAHGFIFFPGEAKSAKLVRFQIKEVDTGQIHQVRMEF